MTAQPSPTESRSEHLAVADVILGSLGNAGLVAAATVAALAFIESWDGAPDLGVASYLFWPVLLGSMALTFSRMRLSATGRASR